MANENTINSANQSTKPRVKYPHGPPVRVNKKAYKRYAQDGYTYEDVKAYYSAIHGAYLSVLGQRPDAILSPLRGSEILVKSMNLFANLDGKSSAMPQVYYPKTGQINAGVPSQKVRSVKPNFEPSLSESEQKREVRRMVDKIINNAQRTHNPKKRVLITLVDEVWSGGALTQVVKMLENVIAERGSSIKIDFNVIAIADARKERCPEYQYLKTRKVVREFRVPRLFTTDSPHFLFPLKRENRPGFFAVRAPFKKRTIERVYSEMAAEGRMRLLSDMAAIYRNSHVPGRAKNHALLGRLVKNKTIHRK